MGAHGRSGCHPPRQHSAERFGHVSAKNKKTKQNNTVVFLCLCNCGGTWVKVQVRSRAVLCISAMCQQATREKKKVPFCLKAMTLVQSHTLVVWCLLRLSRWESGVNGSQRWGVRGEERVFGTPVGTGVCSTVPLLAWLGENWQQTIRVTFKSFSFILLYQWLFIHKFTVTYIHVHIHTHTHTQDRKSVV